MTLFVGRGTSEKVTAESSFATIEGPTPLTRFRPSIEPKGPKESRSATMRLASVGPICLRASICFSVATSRSTGPAGLGGGFASFHVSASANRSGGRNPLPLPGAPERTGLVGRPVSGCEASDTPVSTRQEPERLKRRVALCAQRESAYSDPTADAGFYVIEGARLAAYSSIEVVSSNVLRTSTPAITKGNPRPR
jgi:hypothetical protein